ncbi:MAG: hypothetical protein V4689_05165 [Verrucomicrobiota bacterium]
MNATLQNSKPVRPAHPLYPADQALLWLPGLSGDEAAYCSYNEFRADPSYDRRRYNLLPECDRNGAHYIPPYPVSNETHISWHTNVSPPYPYHSVPLARTLSQEELADLGSTVIHLMKRSPKGWPDPVKVLRNDNKTFVLAALARMNLLPGRTSTLRPYNC